MKATLACCMVAAAAWLGLGWAYPSSAALVLVLGLGATVGYAYHGAVAAPRPPVAATGGPVEVRDPEADRLVSLGFRPDEVRPLLIKARARREADPVGYVMRSLIR